MFKKATLILLVLIILTGGCVSTQPTIDGVPVMKPEQEFKESDKDALVLVGLLVGGFCLIR